MRGGPCYERMIFLDSDDVNGSKVEYFWNTSHCRRRGCRNRVKMIDGGQEMFVNGNEANPSIQSLASGGAYQSCPSPAY